MKICRNILFVLLLSLSAKAQDNKDTLIWTPTNKLKWEDFKGEYSDFMGYVAVSNSVFTYSYIKNIRGYTFSTKAYFLKKSSWVKSGWEDDIILAHEQGHFDITALHALKLLCILNSRSYDEESIKIKTRITYDSITTEMNRMQGLYDVQTLHGTKRQVQIAWEKKIDSMCNIFIKINKTKR